MWCYYLYIIVKPLRVEFQTILSCKLWSCNIFSWSFFYLYISSWDQRIFLCSSKTFKNTFSEGNFLNRSCRYNINNNSNITICFLNYFKRDIERIRTMIKLVLELDLLILWWCYLPSGLWCGLLMCWWSPCSGSFSEFHKYKVRFPSLFWCCHAFSFLGSKNLMIDLPFRHHL